MKHYIKAIILLFLVCISTIVLADDNWTYAGKFVLKADQDHTSDTLLINHLSTYQGQPIGIGPGQYLPYEVYYQHDHSSDEGTGQKEYADWKFIFATKIVPLNINWEPKNSSGVECGSVVSLIDISTKGVYGVSPKTFRIYDRVTHQLIFEASGKMRSQQLYKNSAAEAILKQSAPHPVARGTSDDLNGYGYYPYR